MPLRCTDVEPIVDPGIAFAAQQKVRPPYLYPACLEAPAYPDLERDDLVNSFFLLGLA
jgi:hypothetical protein